MKKLTLLLAVVSFFCLGKANAQDGKGSINSVPYVGVNNSNFSGDAGHYFGETSGKLNLMAGIRFEFQILEKSAIIADVNYRRLGATTGNAIHWHGMDDYHYGGFAFGDYNKVEIHEIAKEHQGLVDESTKVTFDCISLALQFKQNIIRGLSARVGVEGIVRFSEKIHYHRYNYRLYQETGKCEESDGTSDANGCFSDHLNAAIPLGLTYDCNSFSINATYHLPITKCNSDKNHDFRYQAFDFTVGYRLPLRKR